MPAQRRPRRGLGYQPLGAGSTPGKGRGKEPASSPAQFLVILTNLQSPGRGGNRGRPLRNVGGRSNQVKLGVFSSKSGGNPTSDPRRYHEGGSPVEEVIGSPPTRDDITIGRPWRIDRDNDIASWADKNVGRARGNLSIQPLDADFNPRGKAQKMANVLLIGVNHPDVDADATGDVARLELSFAASGFVG